MAEATATATKIHVTSSVLPNFYTRLREDTAAEVSRLLQKNHEEHHIYFNDAGFHNHIVHGLLTLYALGASPEQVRKHYDDNKTYQRSLDKPAPSKVEELHDPARFKALLGNEKRYSDYLKYFQQEIEQKGWQNVLNEYLFTKDDERAEALFARLYSGFLHPLIHLGFGVEFEQPAIIAEALAEAATHNDKLSGFLLAAEKKANESKEDGARLTRLLEEVSADKELGDTPRWSDGNKLYEGVIQRGGEKMTEYASRIKFAGSNLEQSAAELINMSFYFTAAAQHPPHRVKFDFYYMHTTNCNIFLPSFLKQTWLSTAAKTRLLEWKARVDLGLYVSRHNPKLLLDEITGYVPKKTEPIATNGDQKADNELKGWPFYDIVTRVKAFEDDGHAPKLVRAAVHAGEYCKEHLPQGSEYGKLREEETWVKIGHMIVDSVEGDGDTWVRSAGFEEAWEKVPKRNTAAL